MALPSLIGRIYDATIGWQFTSWLLIGPHDDSYFYSLFCVLTLFFNDIYVICVCYEGLNKVQSDLNCFIYPTMIYWFLLLSILHFQISREFIDSPLVVFRRIRLLGVAARVRKFEAMCCKEAIEGQLHILYFLGD